MKYEKGKVVRGTVTNIEPYGVFVNFDEYYNGLIHISEISHGFVKDINDFVKIGDNINVEILDIDEDEGHLKLSIKNIKYKPQYKKNKRFIQETPHGFTTLRLKLPIWIEKTLKKIEKNKMSIDKR